jgi:16S rRNA G527 N7-methylase RsmG
LLTKVKDYPKFSWNYHYFCALKTKYVSRPYLKVFPDITEKQKEQFEKLENLYAEWNQKINVISRKDMDALYEKHILHSLGIAKVMPFAENTKVLDIGTGGGFPVFR